MNITMLLEMAAGAMGDRIAVGTKADGITYQELYERAQRAAQVISDAGVERAGLVGLNGDDLPLMLFACSLAGVGFAPMNYRLKDEQLRGIVGRTAPSLVVADKDVLGRIENIEGVDLRERHAFAEQVTDSAMIEAGYTDPESVAIWLFTSGTTGDPKAALLRHRHLVSYVLSTVEFMAADESEANLVSVPPYHIAGMATILSNTYAGRRTVYLPQFDPEVWVAMASEEHITHAMVVPTMLGRILDAMEATNTTLPHLRHLSYGGGRMPLPVIERAMTMLPDTGFVNAYGLTETSSTVSVLGPEDHREAFASDDPAIRARLASVGRPFPSLELEIRDPEGAVLGAGEVGEIYVRGEQIAGEYHGKSALNAEGWFPTNDGGYLDADGFLFVEGRLDDVIVRGGENISPGEIEDVILSHEAVEAVAVIGIPDDEWGEQVAAAIVVKLGASLSQTEICDYVRERLRSTKTPVVVQFREELPFNDTGKLLRRVLRSEVAEYRASLNN